MAIDLHDLAQQRFSLLGAAEQLLLDAISAGQVADCGTTLDNQIRAGLIRWLCVDSAARGRIDVRGIHLHGATISGRLDLAFVSIPFPLALVACSIEKGLDLTETEARAIALDGSSCGPIAAAQLRMRGSLYLRDGFSARGEVRLLGATIKGSLECRNARFFHPEGEAISANGLVVGGSVFMDQGFYAHGTVRLVGASVERMFICSGGRFVNPRREALVADGIHVGGSIMLEKSFVAVGEVRLMGAMVQGDLSCRGGRMLNRGLDALSADGITVNGAVNLNRGFRAIGRLRLVGAAIKRDLTCRDARLLNHGHDALVIDRARIEGNLYLEGQFRSNATVSLRTCRINGDVHVWNARFDGSGTSGLLAENAAVSGKWIWKGIRLARHTRLDLAHARLGQLADEEASWPAPGMLSLNGLSYHSISEGPLDAKRRLIWLRRQPLRPFSQQPYEQLAAALRQAGHDEDAIAVAIAGEDDRLRYGDLPLAIRCRQWALKYLLDYGYKPHHRALLLGTLLMLFGWLLFQLGASADLMSPTRERVYMSADYQRTHVVPPDYPDFNPLVYSIDAFVPFVNLHQEEYWLPNANRRCHAGDRGLPCGALLRGYMWLHISMGWILTTLFAVGLTGLVRKEPG